MYDDGNNEITCIHGLGVKIAIDSLIFSDKWLLLYFSDKCPYHCFSDKCSFLVFQISVNVIIIQRFFLGLSRIWENKLFKIILLWIDSMLESGAQVRGNDTAN